MDTLSLKQRLLLGVLPPLGALTLRSLAASWRIKEAGQSSLSPRANPKQAKIYVVWHEAALAASCYSGEPLHALASRSFDGELISQTLRHLGYLSSARGSSSRGGVGAGRVLKRFLEMGEHALITIDGPRGPRRQAKPGVVHLAQMSGCAIVPVAFACRPGFRLRSWDKMLVPPPFARGVFWFGEELHFASEGEILNEATTKIQKGLDQATVQAEAFLEQGMKEFSMQEDL